MIDKEKVYEALAKARSNEFSDCFFYKESTDQKFKEKLRDSNLKIYGPYHLFLKKIPSKTKFKLYQFNLSKVDNPTFIGNGYIDKHGVAWIKTQDRDTKLANCMQFVDSQMLPGEPVCSVVILEDTQTYIATYLIPLPLEVYGHDGRHIVMELLVPGDTWYYVRGENFKPQESIFFSIHSSQGVFSSNFTVGKDGSFITILPSHGFQTSSTHYTSIDFFPAAQKEPMTLSFLSPLSDAH